MTFSNSRKLLLQRVSFKQFHNPSSSPNEFKKFCWIIRLEIKFDSVFMEKSNARSTEDASKTICLTLILALFWWNFNEVHNLIKEISGPFANFFFFLIFFSFSNVNVLRPLYIDKRLSTAWRNSTHGASLRWVRWTDYWSRDLKTFFLDSGRHSYNNVGD